MLLIASLFFAQNQTAPPQQVKGAEVIIPALEKAMGQPPVLPPSALAVALDSFNARSEEMPPNEAAREWLKMFAESGEPSKDKTHLPSPRSEDVLASLPPPAAWPTLAQLAKAKPEAERSFREQALIVICDDLVGNASDERRDLDKLIAVAPAERSGAYLVQYLLSLKSQLAKRSGDPQLLREAVAQEGEVAGNLWAGATGPDFVTLLGSDRARPILKRAMLSGALNRYRPIPAHASATAKVLAEIAKELLPQLTAPPWGFASRVEGAWIYPAIAKRWGRPINDQLGDFTLDERRFSKVVYAVSLELAGKHSEAVKQADDWDWPSTPQEIQGWDNEALDRPEYKRAYYNLETSIATKSPNRVDWDNLAKVAKDLGKSRELASVGQIALTKKPITAGPIADIEKIEIETFLADDKIDQAATILRKEMKAPQSPEVDQGAAVKASLKLIELGLLTDRPAWVSEAISVADLASPDQLNDLTVRYQGQPQSFNDLLITLGRGPEAEQRLEKSFSPAESAQRMTGGSTANTLAELVKLYYRANRPADVLTILEEAPGWNADDLSKIYFLRFSKYRQDPNPALGFYAAWALVKVGRPSEADQTLQPTLHADGGFDPAYELLLDLEGSSAIPEFDALAKRDQYQSRPLIWKAEALRRAGRLSEAEVAARAAIKIDPSDADASPEDRFKAYEVLANIRNAQGDKKEAAHLRTEAAAIRLSERADDLADAGLTTRAINAYKTALAKSDEIYDIEMGLAAQLCAAGRAAEATTHARRACELMAPGVGEVQRFDQYGEYAFFREPHIHPTIIASLTAIEAKSPTNPFVHELLGQSLNEDKDAAAALAEYRLAVKFDPDDIEAWQGILDSQLQLDPQLRDSAGKAVLRLDPYALHSYAREIEPLRPRVVWESVRDSHPIAYEMPQVLLRLAPTPPEVEPGMRRFFDPSPPTPTDGSNLPGIALPTPRLRVSHLLVPRMLAYVLSVIEGRAG